MARKVGTISFKTGEFTGNDGQTRGRWLRCGVLFQGDDGTFYGTLDGVPIKGDGKFSVFADDSARGKPPADDGDIPF